VYFIANMALKTEYTSVVRNSYRCLPSQATFIDLGKGSSPRIRLVLLVLDENGVEVRRDIVGANPVSLYLKASPEDADGAPTSTCPNGGISIVDAANGVVEIAFSSADTDKPNKFWRLTVTKGTVTTTAGYGTLRIVV
jgi:hypothetical protein